MLSYVWEELWRGIADSKNLDSQRMLVPAVKCLIGDTQIIKDMFETYWACELGLSMNLLTLEHQRETTSTRLWTWRQKSESLGSCQVL